jgi:hypothetical protein
MTDQVGSDNFMGMVEHIEAGAVRAVLELAVGYIRRVDNAIGGQASG